MTKTMKFLSMAALAIVGAMTTGCSSDDDSIIDNQQLPETTSKTVTLKTTVGLDGGATTRALDPTTRAKTFAAGETMAVIYSNGISTVKAVSHALEAGDLIDGGTSATFTFELETPNKDVSVTYIYPASMANNDGSINYDALNTQNGTLSTLASNLDLATYAHAWNGASLPSGTLVNELAILAVTLKDSDGSNEITSSITGMTISDGTYSYSVSPSSLSTIYVAIRPTATATIDVTATDGTTDYTKNLTEKTYAAGNGYNVSWRMAPAAAEGHALTSAALGEIICSDGKAYAGTDYNNLPSGVTAVAKVCYVDNDGHGLALAMEDESGTMNRSTAISTAAAHEPAVTGGTWRLPTYNDFDYMFNAIGTSGVVHSKLRDGFKSVGGVNMVQGNYWTSGGTSNGRWRYYNFSDSGGGWGTNGKNTDTYYVRACLAF